MSRIFVIQPYWEETIGTWVFDDPAVGLVKEPFVLGADTMLDFLVSDLEGAQSGFRLFFSIHPFQGEHLSLWWNRSDGSGHWYYSPELGYEAWLCPALHKYYPEAPQIIYMQARPLESSPKEVVRERLNKKLSCHVTLVGDSIFDNGVYVDANKDVRTRLNELIEEVTLCARDGATTTTTHYQLKDIPQDTDYLVLSVGGNDALKSIGVVEKLVDTVGEALRELSEILKVFDTSYKNLMQALIERAKVFGCKLIICTIYNPIYSLDTESIEIGTALSLFNDVIMSTALENDLPIIDLRRACFNKEDFVWEIEPSAIGGEKIAIAIRDKIRMIEGL